jgi:hypothetical protein
MAINQKIVEKLEAKTSDFPGMKDKLVGLLEEIAADRQPKRAVENIMKTHK